MAALTQDVGVAIFASAAGMWTLMLLAGVRTCSALPCSVTSHTCYSLGEEDVTWLEAEYACASQGEALAQDSPELRELLKELEPTSYWAQSSFTETTEDESRWQWIDGEEAQFGFNSQTLERRCAVLNIYPGAAETERIGAWDWAPCALATKGAFCQTDYPMSCKLTDTGSEYKGFESKTASNRSCLPWVESPMFSDWTFPDGSATVAGDRCRNPDQDLLGPFCYKQIQPSEFGYCSQIQHCAPSGGQLPYGYKSQDLTSDDVTCVGDRCFLFLPSSRFGSKTWFEAMGLCTQHQGQLLHDPPSQQVLRKLFGDTDGENEETLVLSLWLGATNHLWKWMLINPYDPKDGMICPSLDSKLTQLEFSDCTLKQRYICQRENENFDNTTTIRATTAKSPMTTSGFNSDDKLPISDDDEDEDETFTNVGIGVGIGILVLIILLVIAVVCLICTVRKTKTIKGSMLESPPSSPISDQVYINNNFTADELGACAAGGTDQLACASGPISGPMASATQEENVYENLW